jgi:hypothetical protein
MRQTRPPASADTALTAAAPRPLALPLLLLAIGVALWVWLNAAARTPRWAADAVSLAAGAAAAGLLFVPAVRRFVNARLDRLRRPDAKTCALTAVAIALAAATYLGVMAFVRGRELFPRMHDEFSYLLGARMLAGGRLWMPAHPLGDFFESFHVLVRPVYASIYFPGTALMHVPGAWAGLPAWVTAVALAGAVVGMTYRVVAEVLDDGVAGILASLVVVANARFRQYSTLALAEAPVTLLALAMLWAWLRWRRGRRPGWAAVVGAAAGWAAITRPADALAFAIPVGVAMAWDLFGATPRRPAKIAATAGALLAAAAPFLALQLAFNRGVTGEWLTTPYVRYLRENQPGSAFGSDLSRAHAVAARPASTLPQKQIYYDQFLRDQATPVAPGKLRLFIDRGVQAVGLTLPTLALVIVTPAAVLRLRRGWAWVLCVVPPLFVALYTLNPHFLGHYALPLVPAMACWVVAGAAALSQVGARHAPAAPARPNAWLTVAVAAACAAQLPGLNPRVDDEGYRTPLLSAVEQALATVEGPAVVLFRFHPGGNVHEEPVYNSGVAWPDDAAVVRAHDLGPARNAELFAYYGAREPRRTFYLFDRFDGALVPLGPAQDAAARLAAYDAATGRPPPAVTR